MKEDFLYRKAKKIRNKLIYYVHTELKKKSNSNNHYLQINSLSPKEINNKYQKCSDYCVKETETYSSSQMNNGVNNNNYFHISVTYCPAKNNYCILVDNDQMIAENNIVGKYYKGNPVHVGQKKNSINYNINTNENSLVKIKIGDKKLKKKRLVSSSIDITTNILVNNSENNFKNNFNSNQNNYNKINYMNSNNETNKKIQSNCVNKTRKSKQKIINAHIIKLKKYCQKLKIMKKKEKKTTHKNKNQKHLKIEMPILNELKKNFKKERHNTLNDIKKSFKKERNNTLKSEKNHSKAHFHAYIPIFSNREYNNPTQSDNQFKLKSQTKINHNLFKIPEKKNIHKMHRAQSIDINGEKVVFPKKHSPKKNASPKKLSPKKNNSPKKVHSPKKILNTMRNNEEKVSNIMQKYRKNKANESKIKKFISGGIDSKRKLFNKGTVNFKYTSNTNGVAILNAFKSMAGINKKPANKHFKRANTGINKYSRFKGNDFKVKTKEY